MTIEFDRYAIERTMRRYSNDLLSATQAIGDRANAIARAQSMLADMRYLQQIAAGIDQQVRDAQREAPCAQP
ncbi:MAG: hypothetical protein ABI790_05335 [Betaproteobacteria bacterium]